MQVSETEIADGMLMLITIRWPFKAVPQLAARDSSLQFDSSYPGYFAGTGGLVMFSDMLTEMYKLAEGAFQSRALTSRFTKTF